MNAIALDLPTLRTLTLGQLGQVDVACPLCGPDRRSPLNRKRKVLRIWDDGEFLTYNCARCGEKGWATDRNAGASPPPPRRPVAHAADRPDDRSKVAATLWAKSVALSGTPADFYLAGRMCFLDSPSLRFLPARNDHPPAMIARFGSGPVTGIHLTRLKPDGSGKAGTDKDKLMLGRSMGQPIIVHDNPDRGEVAIAEGIEDAASLALATGWSAWAAGAAVRIPAVVASAERFETVYVATDLDWGTRERSGPKALARARVLRPDLIPIHFERALGARERVDANKALQKWGPAALIAVIEYSEAQARHARSEIGFSAMQRITEPAVRFFTTLAPDAAAE